MSKKHPIVVITGSSGAGTSTVKKTLISIFQRQKINPAVIEGDSFHRYNRQEVQRLQEQASSEGENFSQFGAGANQFQRLEQLFKSYGETNSGEQRHYLHNEEEVERHSKRLDAAFKSGQFTPWEPLASDTDLLFYEGL
ncbi:MAG: phosphoribulokinase, partial [Rubritalea sp.]